MEFGNEKWPFVAVLVGAELIPEFHSPGGVFFSLLAVVAVLLAILPASIIIDPAAKNMLLLLMLLLFEEFDDEVLFLPVPLMRMRFILLPNSRWPR